MAATQTPSGPPAELRFRPQLRLVASLRGLWRSRELVRSLAEREIRARYKQAVLGFAWALITPLALMLVFTAFFQRVAKVQTSGAPYALFAYLGLLPWTFFSTSMSQGGQSLILNTSLLNKVYCPREVFPLASVVVAGTDMAVATVALVVLFPIMGYVPRATSAWVPVLLLIQVAFTAGVTLAMSAVIVYLRDLRHALPILLQRDRRWRALDIRKDLEAEVEIAFRMLLQLVLGIVRIAANTLERVGQLDHDQRGDYSH